jgi:hypothetical protein
MDFGISASEASHIIAVLTARCERILNIAPSGPRRVLGKPGFIARASSRSSILTADNLFSLAATAQTALQTGAFPFTDRTLSSLRSCAKMKQAI